jgi:hypothetical protein
MMPAGAAGAAAAEQAFARELAGRAAEAEAAA